MSVAELPKDRDVLPPGPEIGGCISDHVPKQRGFSLVSHQRISLLEAYIQVEDVESWIQAHGHGDARQALSLRIVRLHALREPVAAWDHGVSKIPRERLVSLDEGPHTQRGAMPLGQGRHQR